MPSAFLFAANSAQSSASCSEEGGFGAVEVVVLNEFPDGFRYQIADGEPARNPFPDFRGRNIEPPLERAHAVRDEVRPAPEDDELDEPAQVADAMPRVELRHIVLADEVHDRLARMALADFLDRLDGETRPRAMQLQVILQKAVLPRDRRRDHGAADRGRRRGAIELVRRD